MNVKEHPKKQHSREDSQSERQAKSSKMVLWRAEMARKGSSQWPGESRERSNGLSGVTVT